MGLESSVNFLADFNRFWPLGTDQKRYGDDNVRNIKVALQQSFAGFPGSVVVTGTDGGVADAYTLVPSVLPPSMSNRMVALFVPVANNTGAATLNFAGLGAKAIKSVSGAALVAGDLVAGCAYAAFYNGTEFRLLAVTKNYADQLAFSASLPAKAVGFLWSDGVSALFAKTHTGYAQNEVRGADIASAATINLDAATGNLVHITGTTTITGMTLTNGERTLIFDGALTLTHNAATLDLPGQANILTQAGDRAKARADGGGKTVITSYTRAIGVPVAPFPILHVREQQPSGTNGGTNTIGYATRTLNTVVTNTITGASLAANVVTLPAGTYDVEIECPAMAVGNHQAALYNNTDAAYTLIGTSCMTDAGNAVSNSAFARGRFTITTAKTFTVRHFTLAVYATYGWGYGSGSGQGEVFTQAIFRQVAR